MFIRFLTFFLFLFSLSPDFSFGQTGNIKKLIHDSIEQRVLPGAVFLLNQNENNILLEAFGTKGTEDINSVDTIYDLASLTKIMTATSIMILEERGLLSLNDSIKKFFPSFRSQRKVSVEHLLRHLSGFPSGLRPRTGEAFPHYLKRVLRLKLNTPGASTVYSDLNFILLGEIVRIVSGHDLSQFTTENIFSPLNMTSTFYHIPGAELSRVAPTLAEPAGKIHDPTASHFYPYEVGHAGVFSSAKDLGQLAQMYLGKGQLKGVRILSEKTVRKMTQLSGDQIRGLGWDLLSPYADAPRGDDFPKGESYGHTGYTGTSLWIDPTTNSYYIFLTNRVFLGDDQESKEKFKELRKSVATAAARALEN